MGFARQVCRRRDASGAIGDYPCIDAPEITRIRRGYRRGFNCAGGGACGGRERGPARRRRSPGSPLRAVPRQRRRRLLPWSIRRRRQSPTALSAPGRGTRRHLGCCRSAHRRRVRPGEEYRRSWSVGGILGGIRRPEDIEGSNSAHESRAFAVSCDERAPGRWGRRLAGRRQCRETSGVHVGTRRVAPEDRGRI